MNKINQRNLLRFVGMLLVIAAVGYLGFDLFLRQRYENALLRKIVARLEADSRLAEVLVTGVNYDERTKKSFTTIKFLEYDSDERPLEPKYFTFSGNIIQFQALVIRFNDELIRRGDFFKGKSAYLFWKVFMLDGENTKEYEITRAHSIPDGYKLADEEGPQALEQKVWERFWEYALDPEKAKSVGIKNAQIEAPGTMFVPGILYTIKIEHDGGMRIDAQRLPTILKGETIPN